MIDDWKYDYYQRRRIRRNAKCLGIAIGLFVAMLVYIMK